MQSLNYKASKKKKMVLIELPQILIDKLATNKTDIAPALDSLKKEFKSDLKSWEKTYKKELKNLDHDEGSDNDLAIMNAAHFGLKGKIELIVEMLNCYKLLQ